MWKAIPFNLQYCVRALVSTFSICFIFCDLKPTRDILLIYLQASGQYDEIIKTLCWLLIKSQKYKQKWMNAF